MTDEREIDRHLDADTRRTFTAIGLMLLGWAVLIGLWCASALASDYTRDGGTADFMCCADKQCVTIISQHADSVRARDACGKLTDADGVTRYTRSNAFRITKAIASCPPKPADETQTATCPAGTTGTWTQVRSYVSSPAPTCWTAGPWTPAEPPAGACTTEPPPPPELTAATLDTPTATPNANDATKWDIRLSWSTVTGATSYEVERCGGATCTDFAVIKTVTASPYSNTSIPSSQTYKFRIRAGDGTTKGPYSNVQTFTTPAAPAPPPPATGTASLEWTAPTQYADGSVLTVAGYRVKYGTSATALTQQVQLANPALTTYVVDGLAAGTWYFALTAYDAAGAESVNSNVASKVIAP